MIRQEVIAGGKYSKIHLLKAEVLFSICSRSPSFFVSLEIGYCSLKECLKVHKEPFFGHF